MATCTLSLLSQTNLEEKQQTATCALTNGAPVSRRDWMTPGVTQPPAHLFILRIVLSQDLAYSRCPTGIYSISEPPRDLFRLLSSLLGCRLAVS